MNENRVLPVRVRLRHLETLESYFGRLKNANSMEFLTPTRLSAGVRRMFEDVNEGELFATATESLGQLPEGWFESQRLGAVPRCEDEECVCTLLLDDTFFLCVLCAAGERIAQYPHVSSYVCPQHNRWVGPGVHTQGQLNVTDFPEVRRADQTLARLKHLPNFDLYQFTTLWHRISTWAKADERMELFPLAAHPKFEPETHSDAATFPVAVAMTKRVLSGPFLTRLLSPGITRADAAEMLNEVLAPSLRGPTDSLADELLIWLRPAYFRVAVATRKDPEGKRKAAYPIAKSWRHDLNLDTVDYHSWPQRRSGTSVGFPGFNSPDSPMYITPSYEHEGESDSPRLLRHIQGDLRMEFWWHCEGKPFEGLKGGDSLRCYWICPDGHVTTSACTTKVNAGRAVCAFCSGNRPVIGLNDLATTDPAIAAFWHPTRNAPRDIRTVSVGSAFDAWWVCPAGHEFRRPINDFKQHPSCPDCRDPHRFRATINLTKKYPLFAAQWDPDRNATSEPPEGMLECHDLVWWICENGHPFTATVQNRQRRGGNCPACASRRVVPGITDLATVYPEIAAEFHPTLNEGLLPDSLLPQSQRKVWWLCPNGHNYQCVVAVRTKQGVCCTICSGIRILKGETDLASVRPEVAARWHPTLNGELTAADVHPGSAWKAWFTCPCGKPYRTEIRMMRADRYCRAWTNYLAWPAAGRDWLDGSL